MGSGQKITTPILLLNPPAPKGLKYQLDGYCRQPQKMVFRREVGFNEIEIIGK